MGDTLESGRVILQQAQEVILGTLPGQLTPTVQITGTLTTIESNPSAILTGIQTGTTVGAALNNGTSQACKQVLVHNQPINAINILVGSSALQGLHLTPGSVVIIPIDNVNKVYIKTPSGTSVSTWLAV